MESPDACDYSGAHEIEHNARRTRREYERRDYGENEAFRVGIVAIASPEIGAVREKLYYGYCVYGCGERGGIGVANSGAKAAEYIQLVATQRFGASEEGVGRGRSLQGDLGQRGVVDGE